jgi:hypothetical protein
MKSQTQFFITIVLLFLVLGIAWFSFSTRDQEPVQVFPAVVNRDCAPWDGSAFTISISYDSVSVIDISIWQSPDIQVPVRFLFPDETMRVGNVLLLLSDNPPEQLTGKVFFWTVEQGMPIEGEFNFTSGRGERFEGKFKAEWGNQSAMCG